MDKNADVSCYALEAYFHRNDNIAKIAKIDEGVAKKVGATKISGRGWCSQRV